MIETRVLQGAERDASLEDVARLRIAVFREWPYLYDGDLEYERRYLAPFAESATAVLVGAFDGDRLVGASTGSAMEDHQAQFAAPLAVAEMDAPDVFYCAESVLLPEYRGHGVADRFFDARETAGRALGRTWSVFCAVVRPADHPARPERYHGLDRMWRRRGYAPVEGAVASFAWRDLGDSDETEKPLQCWRRRL